MYYSQELKAPRCLPRSCLVIRLCVLLMYDCCGCSAAWSWHQCCCSFKRHRTALHSLPRCHSQAVGGGCSPCKPSATDCICADEPSLPCRWDVTGKSPVWSHSYEGHTDWVTGVALLQDVLITCSRDQSCKAWLRDKGALRRLLYWHRLLVIRVQHS